MRVSQSPPSTEAFSIFQFFTYKEMFFLLDIVYNIHDCMVVSGF